VDIERYVRWLVRTAKPAPPDGTMIKTVGVSEFVQDIEATFFTGLDMVTAMRPEDTILVQDTSSRSGWQPS